MYLVPGQTMVYLLDSHLFDLYLPRLFDSMEASIVFGHDCFLKCRATRVFTFCTLTRLGLIPGVPKATG